MRNKRDPEEERILLLRMHEIIEKYNAESAKEVANGKNTTQADSVFLERVQLAYLHALIDLRMNPELDMFDIESALVSLMTNMISLFIRSALPREFGVAATGVADRIQDKLNDCLYMSICSTFKNTGEGPRDGDTIN